MLADSLQCEGNQFGPNPLGQDRSCSATDLSLCASLKVGFSPANVMPGSREVLALNKAGREPRGVGLCYLVQGACCLTRDGRRGFPS